MDINKNITKADWITQIMATHPNHWIAKTFAKQGYMIEVGKRVYVWDRNRLEEIEIDTEDPNTGKQLFEAILNQADNII